MTPELTESVWCWESCGGFSHLFLAMLRIEPREEQVITELSFQSLYIYLLICACACMNMHVCTVCTHGGQRTAFRSQLSHSTWILGTELRQELSLPSLLA